MLDLGRHYEDVRRLTWRHPLFRVAVELGHDPDDVLQDVMLRLHRRQQGRSAWDPSRGSLGTYVHMAVAAIVANYIRDHRGDLEVVDPCGDDTAGEVDDRSELDAVGPLIDRLELEGVYAEILRRLARGQGRDEIRRELGLPRGARKVRHVLRLVAAWAAEAA